MKYKYRIVCRGEKEFVIQHRPWFIPIFGWNDNVTYPTLKLAKNSVKLQKKLDSIYDKVVWRE